MLLSETATSPLFNLVPLIVFLPIIGLLLNLIFGGRMGEKAIGWLASIAAGLTFVVSALLAYALWAAHGEAVVVPFADWITIGNLHIPWNFRVDTLSVTMMLVVSGVGTLIHIYAIGYMHEDVRFKNDPKRFRRFFVFLNLFIAMMMILVSGDSYLMLFVGWEGVGLCSFLLIGFWYEMDTLGRPSWANSNAAKKAMITNRIGDFGFLIAAMLMFWHFGSVQFGEVFHMAEEVAAAQPGVLLAITLFLLIGVTGKSAQIPLYVLLPDAMAGPTPVSALIHAATMVTAGVYLVARSWPLYTLAPDAQYIVAMVGAVTALFAATIAVGQYDIKKVLAYSTISQLGFMVAAVGMGAFVAGMFHLVTHAFFKALLFLSAGSVILGLERGHHHLAHHGHGGDHHEEVFDPGDMRNMGGLRKRMPVTFWLYIIGTLALAGIFPFAGFWSKDEILLDAAKLHPEIFILLTIAAFFTAFYMGRQIWMVFFGEPRHEAAAHAEESPKIITVPLMVLAGLSVLGGALNLPGVHTLGHWLEHTIELTKHEVHLPAWLEISWGGLNPLVALISTLLALLAIYLSWLIYGRKPLQVGHKDPLKKALGPIFTGMENKWFVDEGYWAVFVDRYVDIARFLADVVDWRFWHDWFHDKVIAGTYNWLSHIALNRYADQKGIDAFFNGLGELTKRLSVSLRRLQNGFVRSYALAVMLGVVIILGYLLMR
ncbi:MAG: NADH-quinone oxidoreductase subunit L [Anaerolineales bacterium]|nr:NADH-quinone oxidoreductase subunit L [Anaerolineales bacterium]